MLYAVKPQSAEIKSAERREDELFLFSDFAVHRVSPKNPRTVRVTVTQEKDFSDALKPGTVGRGSFSEWEFDVTDSEVIVRTSELTLKISRKTASYSYYDAEGRLLMRDSGRDSVEFERFTVYRMTDAETEKVYTADGVKEVVKEARRVEDGHSFHVRLNLDFQDGEALYGLGQHEEGFGSLRGKTVFVHQANRKIALPVLVSSLGYGILVDTYSPLIFSDSELGSYIYSEAAPELDYYFMYGGDMRSVVSQYRFITGKAAMLPRWAFGYIQSQERYETQEELLEVTDEYRSRGIGFDCIVLDWNSWPDGEWGQKTLDPKRFPDPCALTENLHKKHTHLMVSIWPNPSQNTADYAELCAAGHILPACTIYNALSKEGREMYWNQLKRGLFSFGADAWWCDNSEPFTPEWNHAVRIEPARLYTDYCFETADHLPAEYTNAFPLYHAMGIYDGQRAEMSGKRVCNLTRSSYTGQQRFGAILWSGDVAATWDTLRRQVAAGLNFSASGQPYWTTDIGAFFVKKSAFWYWRGDFDGCFNDLGYRELFTRWYQWGAFLPVFRGHGTDCRRELWNCENADVLFYDALIKANKLRYLLMPYIYSAAGHCWLSDGSMIENLAFAFSDETVKDIADQYIFGGSIMVCPVTEPMYYLPESRKIDAAKTRKVYLPKDCGWYDFYTNEFYKGGQWIDAAAPIDRIPLYVREGSVIPTAEPALSTEEQSREIALRVYAGRDAEYLLYEDEFDGYGYENGNYILTELKWDDEKREISVKRHTDWQMTESEAQKRYIITKTDIIGK